MKKEFLYNKEFELICFNEFINHSKFRITNTYNIRPAIKTGKIT